MAVTLDWLSNTIEKYRKLHCFRESVKGIRIGELAFSNRYIFSFKLLFVGDFLINNLRLLFLFFCEIRPSLTGLKSADR
jgi:hypothetical protein